MLLLAALPLLPLASAWGFLGHRTVAYLAQLHFTPNAQAWVESILEPGTDISTAAIWPDTITKLDEWKYTKPWHYIDAEDNPPLNCTMVYKRDCPVSTSCIVTQIKNHTARVQNPRLSLADRSQSLKFLMHFVGDVHQPLHTEARGYGGNTIYVKFDGKQTNLHATWDYLIPAKHINITDEILGARAWAAKLFDRAPLRECYGSDMTACALEWATEANKIVCDYVLHDNATLKYDLGDKYYKGAVPIVDQQVKRAGRRLGALINYLAARAIPPPQTGDAELK